MKDNSSYITIEGYVMTPGFINLLKKHFPKDNKAIESQKDMLMEIQTGAAMIAAHPDDDDDYVVKNFGEITVCIKEWYDFLRDYQDLLNIECV